MAVYIRVGPYILLINGTIEIRLVIANVYGVILLFTTHLMVHVHLTANCMRENVSNIFWSTRVKAIKVTLINLGLNLIVLLLELSEFFLQVLIALSQLLNMTILFISVVFYKLQFISHSCYLSLYFFDL